MEFKIIQSCNQHVTVIYLLSFYQSTIAKLLNGRVDFELWCKKSTSEADIMTTIAGIYE